MLLYSGPWWRETFGPRCSIFEVGKVNIDLLSPENNLASGPVEILSQLRGDPEHELLTRPNNPSCYIIISVILPLCIDQWTVVMAVHLRNTIVRYILANLETIYGKE